MRRQPGVHQRRNDREPARAGLAARLLGRIVDNPAMAGGLAVMGLTAAAIVSNAVLLQQSRHPDPLFSTRQPGAEEEGTPTPPPAPLRPSEVPIPRSRDMAAVSEPQAAPLPQPEEGADPRTPASELVVDLQRRLAERGLYQGRIDGISGSRTQAAIAEYQKAVGLPVTGAPSPEMLEHIKTASVQVPGKPRPRPAGSATVASDGGSSDSSRAVTEDATELPDAPRSAPPQRTDEAAAGAPDATRPPEEAIPEGAPIHSAADTAAEGAAAAPAAQAFAAPPPAGRGSRYRAVQHALNQIGYGPIAEDGRLDEDTQDAIRRFELDNGLTVTGRAGQQVIERLVAIGALEAI